MYPSVKVRFNGGPFDGEQSYLSVDGDRKTTVFSVGSQRGYYAAPAPAGIGYGRNTIYKVRAVQQANWVPCE